MQDMWMNQQLDTPEKLAAFREDFQQEVYAKAFSLTRNEDSAQALTNQLFTMMGQRFCGRVLPRNILSYLKGQTSLLHARMNSEPTPVPEVVAAAPAAPAVKAFRVHRVRKPAPVIIPEEEVAEVLNITEAAESVAREEPPAAAAAAAPAPAQEAEPTPAEEPLVEPATREETEFDEEVTALWMPGESFDLEEHAEVQEAFRNQPKDDGNKRSVKLTIFNTFLFLCAIGATIFLLAELGLLPKLF